MKSLLLGRQTAVWQDVPDPVPDGEWVVVRIEASPICGSDRGAFFHENLVAFAGHEGAGVVTATAGSNLVSVGDRVILNPLAGCGKCRYCRSGNYIYCREKPPAETHFAQYVRVQDFVLTPLPEDIDYDIGALAGCALGPAFNAARQLGLRATDNLLITGLGPVGMGALSLAKLAGARVAAVEGIAYRRQMGLSLGADAVFDPAEPDLQARIIDFFHGGPLLKGIETSGNTAAQRTQIQTLQPLGHVVFIGQNQQDIPLNPSRDIISRGLTVSGAWHYNTLDGPEMISVLRRAPNLRRLITHTFGIADVQKAFEVFFSGEACKVMLHPHE